MKIKAQVVLETALVLIAATIFLVGTIKIWAWFGRQYVGRWSAYERTRVTAGKVTTYSNPSNFIGDRYNKEKLNLFK
jgi:hypothetical protein